MATDGVGVGLRRFFALPGATTVAIALGIANFALVSFGSLSNFATLEEGRQLPAGLAHWKSRSFQLGGDTTPLPRLIAVLPILASNPDVDQTFAFESYQRHHAGIDRELSQKFHTKNIAVYADMLFKARLANFAWWCLGAWLIVRWSRDVHGKSAGLLGLALWALSPNVLGLEMLATPELPASVAFLGAAYTFLQWLGRPSRGRAAAAGVALGVALLTDFAALTLCAILPAAWLAVRRLIPSSSGIRHRDLQLAAILGLALVTVNAGYFFTGVGTSLGDVDFASSVFSIPGSTSSREPTPGGRFRGSWLEGLPTPVPADYLQGIDQRIQEAEARPIPAPGDRDSSPSGRRQAAVATLAATVPLGAWALLAWTSVLALSDGRRHGQGLASAFLWAALVFGAAAILAWAPPILRPRSYALLTPLAFVAIDGLGRFFRRGPLVAGAMTAVFAVWAVASGLTAYPRSIGYLNEAVGGTWSPTAQAAHASAADCGQDMALLRAWLEGRRDKDLVGVACDSVMELKEFAIKHGRPPINPGPKLANDASYTRAIGPYPGVYAIDAYNLARPRWRYFQEFEPVERLGTSTFVYRIDRDGAEAVRWKLGLPPLPPTHPAEGRQGEYGFLHRVHRDPDGKEYNYAVFVPKDYTGDRSYPLIMMLHGYGDRGFDGRRFLKVGLPRAVEARKDSFSFLVVCPEGHEGNWAEGGDDARIVMEILAKTADEFNVDARRLYLTGVSSGAAAAWRFAARFPDLWAAVFPTATSDCDPGQAAALKDTPIWCFHNYNDDSAPPRIPRAMIRAIEEAGGRPRYTEFVVLPDDDKRLDVRINRHNSWTKAYATEDLYDWLLENKRPRAVEIPSVAAAPRSEKGAEP